MCSTGDCFVVLPTHSAGNAVIFGRNSLNASLLSESQEVVYYDSNESLQGKSDGGAAPAEIAEKLRVILQKPQTAVWGADFGANERNVSIGISFVTDDAAKDSGQLQVTDILRYALVSSISAENAVQYLGDLVALHVDGKTKFSLVICDATEVWLFSAAGKLWAAQCLKDGYQRVPCNGLSVTTQIDKFSSALSELLQNEENLNFAKHFDAVADASSAAWIGAEPNETGSYSLLSMFETLRAATQADSARAASISVLSMNGISCHWFTGTPNASGSVFKPFVFSPNPKISPLTKVTVDCKQTLLHKLHAQCKPSALEDLKCLEAACVEEINKYLAEHPAVNDELDELLKDCVEAEVKFYR